MAARPRSAVHKRLSAGKSSWRENTLSQTASFRERGAGGPAVSISRFTHYGGLDLGPDSIPPWTAPGNLTDKEHQRAKPTTSVTASSPRHGEGTGANAHRPRGALAAQSPPSRILTEQKSTTSTNQKTRQGSTHKVRGSSRAAGSGGIHGTRQGPVQLQGWDRHRAPRHKLPEAQISAQQARGSCKQLTRP